MRKAGTLATLGAALLLSPLGCNSDQKQAVKHDEGQATDVKKHERHEHHGPTFETVENIAKRMRKDYGRVLQVAQGTPGEEVYGQEKWVAATKGGYRSFVVCSDERVMLPPQVVDQCVKVGLPGAQKSEGTIKHLKEHGNVQYVGWHQECAANGSQDEKSQAAARGFAFDLGLGIDAVKSFGFKGTDYRMEEFAGSTHHHPAKGLRFNVVPNHFNPGQLDESPWTFDIACVGQTPEELQKHFSLLVHVAMKCESPEMRAKLKMPLLVHAVGSKTDQTKSYQQTFSAIESAKPALQKQYGPDAIRYVGFNIDTKK